MSDLVRQLSASAVLLGSLLGASSAVRAAESYDGCAGFIDTLPTIIGTQGVWCLRHDLSTGITSGSAVTVTTNNVTIDCNGFKLGGLPAGLATTASGIRADDRLNVTIRHCSVRGFAYGANLAGASGGGHVVEDNRFDNNTYIGMQVGGDGSVIRRNQVNDTGGSTSVAGLAYGIWAINTVDVVDNIVSGVLPGANGGNGSAYGIYTVYNPSGSITGNQVRGLVRVGTGSILGIDNANSDRLSLEGNHVIGDGGTDGIGVRCSGATARAKDNIINGFATGLDACGDAGGNDVL